jgi:osmoprotectant transport system permease protein
VTRSTEAVRAHAKVVAVAGSALGIAVAFAERGLLLRDNRIHRGVAVSLFDAAGQWGWVLMTLWVLAALLALAPLAHRIKGPLVTGIGILAPLFLTWSCGMVAAAHTASTSDIARTSLGWAFWASLFASYVVIFAATAWIPPGPGRVALAYTPVVGVAFLLASGHLAELGIAREYANNADGFWREFRLHLSYVGGAVGVGAVAGLALGIVAARRPPLEAAVFGTLNVLQVLPTLAFIGLMNPVLSGLSDRIEPLRLLGVRGVGWAPVIIVLSSYAVYPIARNTHAAIQSLDPEVVDAARGVGMGRWRMLSEVELPMALPVIIAGLRVALVQSTAGAIIAGLVGGGGLGLFVFLGAGETASDLILLGVLPIVALALFFDRTVRALQHLTGSWSET